MIAEAIQRLTERGGLERAEMAAVIDEIMEGACSEAQKAAFLVALRMKGETPAEIAGAADVMRRRALIVTTSRPAPIDTCGTGGDERGTFNISTAAALVAAGAGVTVAKHGNRSVSSQCGSADVLAALGVRLELTPERMGACLDEVGMAFLFAPLLHPAMRQVMEVRRELKLRTVFNTIGPLANPARVRRQVLGVYQPALVPVMAEVLRELGAEHALVVHGQDGCDEISVTAPTACAELRGGKIVESVLTPEDLGLARCAAPASAMAGGSAADNAAILGSILTGEIGPRRDVVLANAAAAIYVGGAAATLAAGVTAARQSIDSGAAAGVLAALVAFTNTAETTA